MIFAKVFESLTRHDRWLCWTAIARPDQEKPTKVPVDPRSMLPIDGTDPTHWMPYLEAQRHCAINPKCRLGYALGDGEHWCLDLDGCNGTHPWTSRFPGAAVEISASGTGLHVWGRAGNLGAIQHAKRCAEFRAELYSDKRFIAMGDPICGSSSVDLSSAFVALVDEYFPPAPAFSSEDWTEQGDPDTPELSDEELVRRACAAKSARATFGSTASFRDLWDANESALEGAYPPFGSSRWDESAADLAMASHLAFWTGKNCERILRIMHASQLARPKWFDRPEYLRTTILRAVAGCRHVYTGTPSDDDGTSAIRQELSENLVSPDESQQMFAHHLLVVKGKRICLPDRRTLTLDEFDFAHSTRTFMLPSGKLTRKASLWVQHHGVPRVDDVSFDARTTDRVIHHDGLAFANLWPGIRTKPIRKKPDRLLAHIADMYSERDGEILLAALAGYVQHVGHKCPWMVVQYGPQGNGKSTISDAMIGIFGEPYCARLRPAQLGARFNSNLFGKVLGVIDDIDRSDSIGREAIKSLVTARNMEIEMKHQESASRPVCLNLIANTNRLTALPKSREDRRLAVLTSLQSTRAEVEERFSSYYFDKIRSEILTDEGYGRLLDFLGNYPIPAELDFRKEAVRAPRTSREDEAIEAGLSPVGQEILEAREHQQQGFRGGWISTRHVFRVLEDRHFRGISRAEVADTLGDMGYEKVIRTTRIPRSDTGRTTLYALQGMAIGEDPIEEYDTAQEIDAGNAAPAANIAFGTPVISDELQN